MNRFSEKSLWNSLKLKVCGLHVPFVRAHATTFDHRVNTYISTLFHRANQSITTLIHAINSTNFRGFFSLWSEKPEHDIFTCICTVRFGRRRRRLFCFILSHFSYDSVAILNNILFIVRNTPFLPFNLLAKYCLTVKMFNAKAKKKKKLSCVYVWRCRIESRTRRAHTALHCAHVFWCHKYKYLEYFLLFFSDFNTNSNFLVKSHSLFNYKWKLRMKIHNWFEFVFYFVGLCLNRIAYAHYSWELFELLSRTRR